MRKFSLFKEAYEHLKSTKKWWLAPIIIFFVILAALTFGIAQNSWIAPVIYPLF